MLIRGVNKNAKDGEKPGVVHATSEEKFIRTRAQGEWRQPAGASTLSRHRTEERTEERTAGEAVEHLGRLREEREGAWGVAV